MNIIIILLYILLFNAFTVLISKKSFGKCLPISLIVTSLTLFFSQFIFHTFKFGIYLNIFIPFLFILVIIYMIIKKNTRVNEFKGNYFSKGFFAFLLIFLLITILDLKRGFTQWDEYSHWGKMIKEMLRIDRFYTVDSSMLLVHKDYPPIIQLLETFFCYISGGFSESISIMAINLFSFSLFIPAIFEKQKDKKIFITIAKSFLYTISIYLCFCLIDTSNVLNTLYLDFPMAIICAYCLFTIFNKAKADKIFENITLCLCLTFLLLTKQMGIALYAMILFFYICNLIIENHGKIKEKIDIKKVLLTIFLLIIIPLGCLKLWNNYTSDFLINIQFESEDIKISMLPSIVLGNGGEEWQRQATHNYLSSLLNNKITNVPISLTFWQLIVLVSLILFGLWYVTKEKSRRNKIVALIATYLIGAIGYSLTMLVLYCFSFGPIEGPGVASYARYMSTYITIGLSLIFMIVISMNNKNSLRNIFIFACTLLLIIPSETIISRLPHFGLKKNDIVDESKLCEYDKMVIHIKKIANKINNELNDEAKVYVLAQDSNGMYQYYINYYLNDSRTIFDTKYHNWTNEEIDNTMKNYLFNYDYMYLAQYNNKQDFINKFGYLFENKNDIEIDNIYEIIKKDNKLFFKKI